MIMMQTCHTPKPHHPSQVKLLMLEFELAFAVGIGVVIRNVADTIGIWRRVRTHFPVNTVDSRKW